MSQTNVREIEENIRKCKEIVDLRTALDRLEQNQDFKRVIAKAYLTDEAVRLVHVKADPRMQTPQMQASIVAQIDAIGGLLSFFRTIDFNANQAGKAIGDNEEALEEIAAAELAGDQA